MKRYFSFFSLLCGILFFSPLLSAKVNISFLFVELSDAMAQIKQQQPEQAKPHLLNLEQQFQTIPTHQSEQGKWVEKALQQAINQQIGRAHV